MIIFWFAASVMIGLALVFVLPALLGGPAAPGPSRTVVNLTIYRERRRELQAEHAAGNIGDDHLASALLDMDSALLHDADEGETEQARSAGRSPYPAVLVAVLIPLAAFGGYLQLGTPEALMETPAAARSSPPATAAGQPEGVPHSVEEMVTRLEQRLRNEPENPEGWFMLGRSYAVMNRMQAAREALSEASRRRPDHPPTLVALAEVMARQQGGRLDGEPIALVERTLVIEPQFARGLWLAGMHAFTQGDPARARLFWQRLAAVPGLSPDDANQVREAIDRAGGSSGATPAVASSVDARIVASITLSPELAARLDGSETLFVFAQAAGGPPIPLAVTRRRADELPLTVTLDDSMAMSPQMRLSSFQQVVVSARVSRSGNATPTPGDLLGRSGPASPGASTSVRVIIDGVVE